MLNLLKKYQILYFVLFFAAYLSTSSTTSFGQTDGSSSKTLNSAESFYSLKVAYVYKFLQFIKIDSKEEPELDIFGLCVLGGSPNLFSAFRKLEGLQIRERKIEVIEFKNAESAAKCQMVFVGHDFTGQLTSYLDQFNQFKIFSVGDWQNFAESGGLIELVEADQKLRFIINATAAKSLGFEISSKLLSLAEEVL